MSKKTLEENLKILKSKAMNLKITSRKNILNLIEIEEGNEFFLTTNKKLSKELYLSDFDKFIDSESEFDFYINLDLLIFAVRLDNFAKFDFNFDFNSLFEDSKDFFNYLNLSLDFIKIFNFELLTNFDKKIIEHFFDNLIKKLIKEN